MAVIINNARQLHPEPIRVRNLFVYLIPPTSVALGITLLMLASFLGLSGCATTTSDTETKPVDLAWPLPPEKPRIKFLGILFSEDQVIAPPSGLSNIRDNLLGKPKQAGRMLKKPYAVHADKSGRIYVADSGWGKVLVFDEKNKSFSIWGDHGRGLLAKPLGITSDKHGHIYISDSVKQRVVVFDQKGEFVRAMGRKGELERPVGIAVDNRTGKTYVVDTKSHNIAVYNAQGSLVDKIGSRGRKLGQFNFPTNIAIDHKGKLYVVDSMNFRVQILTSKGKPIRQFGSNGDGRGQFVRAKGIDVDSEGNIYVVDAAFGNVQIFNDQGQLLMALGSQGRKPGQFQLPAGMHIDEEDRIYVADQYNWRVQIFEYLSSRRQRIENEKIGFRKKDS